ncbi:hypothetical protein [Candidatus Poriferisodalis sp.]|uniref:hypothetical protein n=1 Tax=Candidatus Poriferisodalis sp. TaxID=3101277 RepID=UPI003B018803
MNDTQAIKRLIEALCPELKGRIQARREPTSLQRDASEQSVLGWTDRIADVVYSNERPVACIFVHRDSDIDDPQGRLQQETETALRDSGLPNAHAVVPVHEIEAWWLLFPDATEQLRPSVWKDALQRSSRNWDAVANPKEELRERTGRGDRRHAYSEADSPRIAEHIASAIESGVALTGLSPSFERFRDSVAECCATVP